MIKNAMMQRCGDKHAVIKYVVIEYAVIKDVGDKRCGDAKMKNSKVGNRKQKPEITDMGILDRHSMI